MKKLAACIALLLAGVASGRTIVPQTPDWNGICYRIFTAEELYGFAEIVNGGETHACGVLMNDIVVNADSIDTDYAEWIPIGTKENPFKGTFSGGWNVIYGLYSKNSKNEVMGFLGYHSNDSIETSIVHYLGLENVHFEGSGSIGAFVGVVNLSEHVDYDHVYATGTIKGANGSVVGGIAGTVNGKARFLSVYNTVKVSGTSASSFIGSGDSKQAGNEYKDDIYFKNCYSLSDYSMLGGDDVDGITAFDAKQFEDGTVTVKLNGRDVPKSEYSIIWAQGKGVDHPRFGTSEKHYSTYSPYILHLPDGTTKTDYYQAFGEKVQLDSVIDNKFCFMGWYDSPDFSGTPQTTTPLNSYGTKEFWAMSLPKDKDGWCLIGNADDLYHFAQGVNTDHSVILGRDSVFNGKLSADIVVNKKVLDKNGNLNSGEFRQWTAIGEELTFKGNFDGNGHVISGLYSTDKDLSAFFGWLNRTEGDSVSQTIKNLGIVDSYFSGRDAYGLFYSARGSITIDNCFFEGTLIADEDGDAAGLFQYYSDTTANILVSNSHFKGKIEAGYAGGLAGSVLAREAVVRNSYFEGSIATKYSAAGLILVGGNVTIENCYNAAQLNGKKSGALLYNTLKKAAIVNSYAVFPHFESDSYQNTNLSEISLVADAMEEVKIINSFILIDKDHDKGIPYHGLVAYPKDKFEDGTVAALLHEYCVNGVDGSIWGQEKGAELPNFSGTVVSSKVSYATLTLKTYDGDPNAKKYPTKYVIGHRLILPTAVDVERDDYYFAGWYKKSDFSGDVITELDSTEKKNVTLYARFVPRVSVTLVDELTGKETLVAGKGVERKLPSRSRRNGFVFGGWYKKKDYSGSTLGSITTSKDITLYARWIEVKSPKIKDGCYQISDAGELYGLAEIDDKEMCAELTNDIVLNRDVLDKNGNLNEASKDCFAEWEPIIAISYKSFDGNGHTINGLFYDQENGREVGLFGWFKLKTDKGFTISNLGIKDSYIKGKTVVGGIVGRSYSKTKIINSFYEGVVVSRQNTAGGLVGIADDTISIVNSYHLGPIYEATDNTALGAFIGMLYFQSKASPEMVSITNSYHAGELKAEGVKSFLKATGLVGYALTSNVKLQDLVVTRNVFVEGDVPTIGAYYTDGLSNVASKKFASGYVATKLHSYKSKGVDGSIWGQTSGRLYPDFSGVVDKSLKDTTDSDRIRFTYDVRSANSIFNVNVVGKRLQVNSSVTGTSYAIFDMQGSVILQGNVNNSSFELSVPCSGNYIVRIGKATRLVNVK